MALVKKSAVTAPVLPREAVPVASLGGDVAVRGLLLSERLALFSEVGESGKAFVRIPRILAATVQDADGLPLFTEDEWEAHGAKHQDEALALFAVARRLSGLDAESAEKN